MLFEAHVGFASIEGEVLFLFLDRQLQLQQIMHLFRTKCFKTDDELRSSWSNLGGPRGMGLAVEIGKVQGSQQ